MYVFTRIPRNVGTINQINWRAGRVEGRRERSHGKIQYIYIYIYIYIYREREREMSSLV